MKKISLLPIIAVLSFGCISIKQVSKMNIQSVNSMKGYSIIWLTDGKVLRIYEGDSFIVSDKYPEGACRLMTMNQILFVTTETCQCNKKQIIDCFKN